MLRLLDQRDDDFELLEVTSLDDLDWETLVPMVDRAWSLDYRDQIRQDFNQEVFRKLLHGSSWVAVLARSSNGSSNGSSDGPSDGAPIGFEVAFQRTLHVGPRSLKAYYASVFSVSVDHRRKGIGRWVLEGINRLVFEQEKADLILSTFHQGHAGSPVVQSTFDRIEGWGVNRFHSTPIWGLRLDKGLPPPRTPELRFERLVLPEGEQKLVLTESADSDASDASSTIEVPSLEAIHELVRAEFQVAFDLDGSLRDQYLNPSNDASGFLACQLPQSQLCLAGYNIMPMMMNDKPLQPVAQLQFLLAPGYSDEQIRLVVDGVAHSLKERGCFALTLVDMGMVPTSVLTELGFSPTDDGVVFAARGPKTAIDLLQGVQPPYFLDFT